jgi:hypothetical protein
MGMRMPGTCWAIFKRQVINLSSCCILLFDSVEKMRYYFIVKHVSCIFHYFVLWPTNAQLFHKLSHSYMLRHYREGLQALWGWQDSVETCRNAIICERTAHLLVIVQKIIKDARYMYWNNRGPTGKNLQLQKHQAEITENEWSHLVEQNM